MSQLNKKSSELILAHLLDVAASKCSITEEAILAEEDNDTQEILGGILILHEELEYREEEKQKVIRELERMTKRLESRVEIQAEAIMELSTPVLEVWPKVLILPLIGTVDTQRAEQIIDQALDTVAKRNAAALIIDITGVPVLDTAVANHLLQTIEAVRIIGAQSILTGVSPPNAQTLTRLGVDLSKVVTKGSLYHGLKFALDLIEE